MKNSNTEKNTVTTEINYLAGNSNRLDVKNRTLDTINRIKERRICTEAEMAIIDNAFNKLYNSF